MPPNQGYEQWYEREVLTLCSLNTLKVTMTGLA